MRSLIPESVRNWLEEQGHGEVSNSSPVSGGCISHGMILETHSGNTFFLKTNYSSPKDMFVREAEGLEALRVPGGPRIPAPYCYGNDFILMEDLSPQPRQREYWIEFGRQLARLHNHTSSRFGFSHDNYIGSTPQPNSWTTDGYTFFAEQRLLFQARLARQQGLLQARQVVQVEKIAVKLPELIPAQPASLIHGDLWSGNAITDQTGAPALIDPAAYYGWAEAELGMTSLFSSFPQDFYAGYQEVRALEQSFRARFPLYNLYHLLNHLNLFGLGYLGQVSAILQQYD